MLGIYIDGRHDFYNHEGMWSVNDLYSGAELQAPMFTHAYFSERSGAHTLSLDATEFPWGPPNPEEDTVIYRVGAGTRFIVLSNGMKVKGSAPISFEKNNWWDYFCVGTKRSYPGCPVAGTPVTVASANIFIPFDHNGVVMFTAKTRVQGAPSDHVFPKIGTVSLWLAIDGTPVGSTGVQQLKHPDGASQRSISASYLAAGDSALSPGWHSISLQAMADGDFKHLSIVKDLPLLWFD